MNFLLIQAATNRTLGALTPNPDFSFSKFPEIQKQKVIWSPDATTYKEKLIEHCPAKQGFQKYLLSDMSSIFSRWMGINHWFDLSTSFRNSADFGHFFDLHPPPQTPKTQPSTKNTPLTWEWIPPTCFQRRPSLDTVKYLLLGRDFPTLVLRCDVVWSHDDGVLHRPLKRCQIHWEEAGVHERMSEFVGG